MSFLKMKIKRGEIPYDDTLVRNVLSKAMPFIANHFNHIRTAATNDGEQPSTVTPISSTCCIIEAGKKGKSRKPKTKKNENKKPRVEIPTSRLTHSVDEMKRFYEECRRNERRLKKKEEKEIKEWNKLKEGCAALKPYPPPIPDPYYSFDSSDDEDLHYSRIPNNCPEEVFDDSSSVCLNTLFEEIDHDESKMEPCVPPISVCSAVCFTNEVQENPVAKTNLLDPKEHYELYPHNSNQGKDSKFNHKYLTPSVQEEKNTYLPR